MNSPNIKPLFNKQKNIPIPSWKMEEEKTQIPLKEEFTNYDNVILNDAPR